MKTAYNFNAGPCVLPKEAIESTIAAIRDFDNTGIGLLEISHRTPGWERTMEETRQLWRDLLGIPAEYEILFLGGGASTGFMDVPANLLNKKAAYLQTGVWAKKAAKEAKNFGETVIVASSEDKTYSYIPKGWTVPADADYFHITTNNTIYGTEIRKDFAANEEEDFVLSGDAEQVAPELAGFFHGALPTGSTVRDLEQTDTGVVKVADGGDGGLDGLFGQDAGTCIEIISGLHCLFLF